jgi:hypothetical protein
VQPHPCWATLSPTLLCGLLWSSKVGLC